MQRPDFAVLLEQIKEELATMINTLRDRGPRPFYRPLAIAILLVVSAYKFVYQPPIQKAAKLKKREAAVKAVAQHAERYGALNARLNGLFGRLPSLSDRDQWLMNSVMDSMRAESVISDTIRPPVEEEYAGVIYQSVGVTMTTGFLQAYAWINRLESARPWLQVASLEIGKQSEPIGSVQVICGVGTIIPKARAGQ